MPYPPQKKKNFYKEKKMILISKGKCPNFANFFRTPKINNSNLLNEKQRT